MRHHPLKSPRALARMEQIRAFMLAYQAENGRPPKLDEVSVGVGLAISGLASCYMHRMHERGLVRKLHDRRGVGWRWEAVP